MAKLETPAAFAAAILAAYQRRNIDPAPAFAAAEVSLARFGADAGAGWRISAGQLERLSDHAMRALDDEGLGWFSRRLPWGSYGMLCRASLASGNLGIAIARWCRHHGLLTQDIEFRIHREGEYVDILIEEHVGLGEMREFCLVSLLRNLHGVACWLGDTRIPLTGVTFPFAAPDHADAYQYIFDGTVQFMARRAGVRFKADYLDLPVLRDDAALRQMLRRPLPLMIRQYRRDRLLAQEVVRILEARPTILAAGVSERLNVSERSLHRHLQKENTSFQILKGMSRRGRAERLLASTNWPLKRIAQECGFRAEESFVRAFKVWTGQTPRAFRQAAAEKQAPYHTA